MTYKLIVGIIGAGRIGKLHMENIVNFIPNITIKLIVDSQIDVVSNWCHDLGIKSCSKDPDDIFNDKEINAVFIFSPTDTHLDYIRRAAQSHKYIFCEKPIGSDLNQIQKVLEVVQKEQVQLMIGFNRRFDHNFRRLKVAITQGDVGKVHQIKITSRDPSPPPLDYIKRSGGLFFDMSIHDFDMARFLAGDEVDEVYATGGVLIDEAIQGIDIDTAAVILKFKNGAMALIDNSRKAKYGYDQRVEVFGSEGAIIAGNDTPNNVTLYTKDWIKADKMHYFFLERYKQSFIDEIKEFSEKVITKSSLTVTGLDGFKAVQIAKAALLSLQENRPIKIGEVDL